MSTAAADFMTLTTARPLAPDRYHAVIPDGWGQGPGTFGGLVLGLMTRVIEGFAGAVSAGPGSGPQPDRPLRSLTATLCGPTRPGDAEVACELLRLGSGSVTVAARLLQEGAVQAHAVAVLARARAPIDLTALQRPTAPPWREVAPFPSEMPFAPAFARHFEFRPLEGALPFAGGAAVGAGWIRMLDPGPARDAAWVVAHADVWWPAIFGALDAPRPGSTIAFTLELPGDPRRIDADAPLLHVGRTVAAREGYTVELRELWTEDGALVALNQQTIVMMR